MARLTLALLAAGALCAVPGVAGAQEEVPGTSRTSTSAFDIELDLSLGVGNNGLSDPSPNRAVAGARFRLVHASGHGLFLGGTLAPHGFAYAVPVFVDLGYQFRLNLAANEHVGLALELGLGPSGGSQDDNGCGLLSSCVDGPAVDGVRVGGTARTALVFHAGHFVATLDLGYRALFPLGAAQGNETRALEHSLSASLGCGARF
ncbi:MAG: hypothetical protein QM765_09010 [Myxococcales bacterium]